MSDEIKNEDVIEESPVIPAVLEPGEAVIPQELVEKYKEAVEELTNKAEEEKVEAVEEPVAEEEPVAIEEPKNVITSGSQRSGRKPQEVAGLTSITGGVIGTGTVTPKAKPAKIASKTSTDKVAIYSSKNVTWSGVGKVYRGYNIVTQEVANKWLTRDHIRPATPEEVAQEFGK